MTDSNPAPQASESGPAPIPAIVPAAGSLKDYVNNWIARVRAGDTGALPVIAGLIIIAVIYLPTKIGGWHHIFDTVHAKSESTAPTDATFSDTVAPKAQWAYVTLAFGSAMALFMYPHSITAVLSSKSRNTIRRNALTTGR